MVLLLSLLVLLYCLYKVVPLTAPRAAPPPVTRLPFGHQLSWPAV